MSRKEEIEGLEALADPFAVVESYNHLFSKYWSGGCPSLTWKTLVWSGGEGSETLNKKRKFNTVETGVSSLPNK